MLKTIFAGLLTATALVPASANAQSADVGFQAQSNARGDYRQRRDDRPAQQADARQQANAQVQAWVDADPQRGGDGGRGDPRRGDGSVQSRDATQDRQNRGGFEARRDDAGRGQGRYDGQDRRNDDRGERRSDGRGFQGQRSDDRGYQDRRDDGRGQAGYRGQGDGAQWQGQWQRQGRQRDQQQGQWNRGWREDNRYDWNRYRTANRGAYRLPRYYAPQGSYGYRRFSIGVTLGRGIFGQNYWINDPYAYRLPEAYGPYRWVRYYDDALLVDIRSGYVVDTVYGIFW